MRDHLHNLAAALCSKALGHIRIGTFTQMGFSRVCFNHVCLTVATLSIVIVTIISSGSLIVLANRRI